MVLVESAHVDSTENPCSFGKLFFDAQSIPQLNYPKSLVIFVRNQWNGCARKKGNANIHGFQNVLFKADYNALNVLSLAAARNNQ